MTKTEMRQVTHLWMIKAGLLCLIFMMVMGELTGLWTIVAFFMGAFGVMTAFNLGAYMAGRLALDELLHTERR